MAHLLATTVLSAMLLFAGVNSMAVNATVEDFTEPPSTTPEFVPEVPQVCLQNLFTCPNKECIPVLKVCDGVADCSDGADERDCSNLSTMILAEQLVAILNDYPGCRAAAENCFAIYIRPLLQNPVNDQPPVPLPSTNHSQICRAYRRANQCLLYESCDFEDAHWRQVQKIAAIISERETGCGFSMPGRPRCASSCVDLPNGNYQSCEGCTVFATCVNGFKFDFRPCPAGLVWDDILMRCEYESATCKQAVPA